MYNFIEPLDPELFCQKWIPRLIKINPDQRGYRTACCELLSYITGKTRGTVQNWFLKTNSSGYRQPEIIVGRYLRVLDLIWEVESLFPIPSYLAKAKEFLQKTSKNL